MSFDRMIEFPKKIANNNESTGSAGRTWRRLLRRSRASLAPSSLVAEYAVSPRRAAAFAHLHATYRHAGTRGRQRRKPARIVLPGADVRRYR